MLELGDRGPALHAELARDLDEADVDLAFLSGPLMARLWEATAGHRRGLYGRTPEDLAAPLLAELRGGDVVMIKGSLGSRMRPIVDAVLAEDTEGAQGADQTAGRGAGTAG
jgi:UDP-N-acetylmuramoyl-tripeptide--D-alanyl-D-alanine ligase